MLEVFRATVLLTLLKTDHGEDIFATYVKIFFVLEFFFDELRQQNKNTVAVQFFFGGSTKIFT